VFERQCIGRGDSYFSVRRKRARRGGDKKRKIGKNKENGESRGCGRTCARAPPVEWVGVTREYKRKKLGGGAAWRDLGRVG